MRTRPEPTINGNCDSWDFIVGKKPDTYSPKTALCRSLQACNRKLINNLFTNKGCSIWITCECSVDHRWTDVGDPTLWSHPCFFVMNIGSRRQILTIFENQLVKKLASTNIKIFFKGGKPCNSKGTLDKYKIKKWGESGQSELTLPAERARSLVLTCPICSRPQQSLWLGWPQRCPPPKSHRLLSILLW